MSRSTPSSLPDVPDAPPLDVLAERVRTHPNVQDKLDIHRAYEEPVGPTVSFDHPFFPDAAGEVEIGDDCAALPNGHGDHLLLAAEGLLPEFVQKHPWFAGYSAVMVNLSDICAMGGRPLAVADTLWIEDQADGAEVWAGMQAAAEAYGVPIVGGHTSYRCEDRQLGVSVLGQAQHLLTSYEAQPDDVLLMAVDLDGTYFEDYPFWNASTDTSAERLQSLLPLMAAVAENGWATAAKDVSMGGLVGTLAMLLHTSEVGAQIRLETVPKPPDVAWEKWLISFPSFGFLLTTTGDHVDDVQSFFHEQNLACEAIGEIRSDRGLWMQNEDEQVHLL
jgi:hypothetical protein